MDTGFIQNLRYKLQKRVRKLNSMQWEYFHLGLIQFWKFLLSHSVFKGILEDLERRSASSELDADKIVNEKANLFGEDEDESVALAYFVIKKCIESENPDKILDIAHTYAQVIDDINGKTIAAANTHMAGTRAELSGTANLAAAKVIGKEIAERVLALGVNCVCFDRGGCKYHGRVKALADAARGAGLKF